MSYVAGDGCLFGHLSVSAGCCSCLRIDHTALMRKVVVCSIPSVISCVQAMRAAIKIVPTILSRPAVTLVPQNQPSSPAVKLNQNPQTRHPTSFAHVNLTLPTKRSGVRTHVVPNAQTSSHAYLTAENGRARPQTLTPWGGSFPHKKSAPRTDGRKGPISGATNERPTRERRGEATELIF